MAVNKLRDFISEGPGASKTSKSSMYNYKFSELDALKSLEGLGSGLPPIRQGAPALIRPTKALSASSSLRFVTNFELPKFSTPLKTQAGFTLVELMVGIGVSAAAMLATATSVTYSLQASKRNENRVQASLAQVQIMNDVHSHIYEGLTNNGAMTQKTCKEKLLGETNFDAIASRIKNLNKGQKTDLTGDAALKQFAGYKLNEDIALSDSVALKIQSIQLEVTNKRRFTVPICKEKSGSSFVERTSHCNDWAETRATSESTSAIFEATFTHINALMHIVLSEMPNEDADDDSAEQKSATFPALQIPIQLYFNDDNKLISCSNFQNLHSCLGMGRQQGMLIEPNGSDTSYTCDTRHATNQAMSGCVQGKMFQCVNGKLSSGGSLGTTPCLKKTSDTYDACDNHLNFEPVKMLGYNQKGYRTEMYQCLKCFQKYKGGKGCEGGGTCGDDANNEYGFSQHDNDNQKRNLASSLTLNEVKAVANACQAEYDALAAPPDPRCCADDFGKQLGDEDIDCGSFNTDHCTNRRRHSTGVRCCEIDGLCSKTADDDLLARIRAVESTESCIKQACQCEKHSSLCEDNWLEQAEGFNGSNWLEGCESKNNQSLLCLLSKGDSGNNQNLCPIKEPTNTVGTTKIPSLENHLKPSTVDGHAYGTGWPKAFDEFTCTGDNNLAARLLGLSGAASTAVAQVYAPIKAEIIPNGDVCNASLDRTASSGYRYSRTRHGYAVVGGEVKYFDQDATAGLTCSDANNNSTDGDCDSITGIPYGGLHYGSPENVQLGPDGASCPCQYFRSDNENWNTAKSHLDAGNVVYDALQPVLQGIIDDADARIEGDTVPTIIINNRPSTSQSNYDGDKDSCTDVPHSHEGDRYLDFCGELSIDGVYLKKTAQTCNDLEWDVCEPQSGLEDQVSGPGDCPDCYDDTCQHSNCGCLNPPVPNDGTCPSGIYNTCQDSACGQTCDAIMCTNKSYTYYTLTGTDDSHVQECRLKCERRNRFVAERWKASGGVLTTSSYNSDDGWKAEAKLYCQGDGRDDDGLPRNEHPTTPPGNAINPLWRETFMCKGVSKHLMGGAGANLINTETGVAEGGGTGGVAANSNSSLPVCCAYQAAKHDGNPAPGSGQGLYYYLGPQGKLVNNPADRSQDVGVLNVKRDAGPPVTYTTQPHVCFKSIPSRKTGGPHTPPPPPPNDDDTCPTGQVQSNRCTGSTVEFRDLAPTGDNCGVCRGIGNPSCISSLDGDDCTDAGGTYVENPPGSFICNCS